MQKITIALGRVKLVRVIPKFKICKLTFSCQSQNSEKAEFKIFYLLSVYLKTINHLNLNHPPPRTDTVLQECFSILVLYIKIREISRFVSWLSIVSLRILKKADFLKDL